MRLWQRVFVMLAAMVLLALALFAAAQQITFERGLLGYVRALEREQATRVAAALADEYRAAGGWQRLAGNPPAFGRLVGRTLGLPGREPGLRGGPPGAGPGPFHDGRGPRGPRDPADLRPRLLLLDADGRVVIGNPGVPRDAPSTAVEVDGAIVGRLLLRPLPELETDWDRRFAADQRGAAALMAVVVLLVALLAAFAWARRLAAPLRTLADGAHRLAAGDFATRVPERGGVEFAALAGDFNRMAAALDGARQARRQWMAEVSHELRTPLAVLRGEIDALADGVRKPDAAAIASLAEEVARLTRLTDDLYQLALSDVGALDYRMAPVDLVQLVAEACAAHAARANAAGLVLAWAPPDAALPPLRADAQRLRQLVDNLLANACRHTQAPGRIAVALARRDGRAVLAVDDTPPGVAAEHLAHLFEPFYRTDASRTRATGGAGLGLALVARIAAAHGGSVRAEASPLGGLRVVVELPLGESS
jgi:two-component system sensor histidine kinase BaeS